MEDGVSDRAVRGHDDRVNSDLGIPEAPPAVRATRPGWRDPRLWVGIVIVAVSVVAGARVVAAADDSVTVWAVADDMGAGDAVTAQDLVAQRVRFGDQEQLARYFPADRALPADQRLARGVGAGELLPRAAVGTDAEAETLQLPIAVDTSLVPPSVGAGSVVDVYLTGSAPDAEDGSRAVRSRAVLAAVTVIDAPPLDEGFAVSGRRQLVLGVTERDAARFFRAVGGLDAPVLTVVRRN